ncbi:MAG: family transporter, partial [Brevundimonas sp.]|nr:family transporter [Brevundimonas sp.]
MTTSSPSVTPKPSAKTLAIASVAVCAVIWGTTWYAITFQLGTVDPIASIVWRFGLASVILFILAKATGQSNRLSRYQHLMAAAQGLLAFGMSYAFVYAAEARITSAIVAVAFASMALLNLIMFRILEGQTAIRSVWIGAGLGTVGVAVMSGGELLGADLSPAMALGVIFSLVGAVASTGGNYFAWRGQQAGSNVLPGTAWAMAYGTAGLVFYGLATGVHWSIAMTPAYIGS